MQPHYEMLKVSRKINQNAREEEKMKICLVIGTDAEKRANMCNAMENMGFVSLEASDPDRAVMTAQGLSPDVILFGDDITSDVFDDGFVEKLRVLKSGKKPFIYFTDQPDLKNLAHSLVEQDLLDEPVRKAMGI